jgi:hypothetical protein
MLHQQHVSAEGASTRTDGSVSSSSRQLSSSENPEKAAATTHGSRYGLQQQQQQQRQQQMATAWSKCLLQQQAVERQQQRCKRCCHNAWKQIEPEAAAITANIQMHMLARLTTHNEGSSSSSSSIRDILLHRQAAQSKPVTCETAYINHALQSICCVIQPT